MVWNKILLVTLSPGGFDLHFKYGFGIYLIVLVIASVLILTAIKIIKKNIRQFNFYWLVSVMLIFVAIAGALFFKSPCLDNVRHTYDIDRESIERIIRSEAFSSENAKERLLKEDNVIHKRFASNGLLHARNNIPSNCLPILER